jgi:hypothetical protein
MGLRQAVAMAANLDKAHQSFLDRVATASIWMQVLLASVVFLPWGLAVPVAFFGPGSSASFSGVAGFGGIIAIWYRERAYWRLDRHSRNVVWSVQKTGYPSGICALDQLAIDRLDRSTPSSRSDRIALPIVIVAFVGLPIVAALRSTTWWLVCTVPVLWLIVVARERLSSYHPEASLRRLRQRSSD